MNDCCMARHAQAIPPWTCDCPCHQRKEEEILILYGVYSDSMKVALFAQKVDAELYIEHWKENGIELFIAEQNDTSF